MSVPQISMFDHAFQLRHYAGITAKGEKSIQDTIIFIPMSDYDVITLDNMKSADYPRMLQEDLDCNFLTNLRNANTQNEKNYDSLEYIKVRVVADFDIFSLTVRTHDTIQEVDTVILDIHGGGFMFGSSKVQTK
jgi:hypothetical protein